VIPHAKPIFAAPHYISFVACLSLPFFRIILKTKKLLEKNLLEQNLFGFSHTLSAACGIRNRIQPDIKINVHKSSSKAPAILLDFNET
jgi:hypothetical protein